LLSLVRQSGAVEASFSKQSLSHLELLALHGQASMQLAYAMQKPLAALETPSEV
jgi:hypothetical protein